jgi:hypothetical protein
MASNLSNIWGGESPFVAMARVMTTSQTLKLIAAGHEGSVRRLKDALTRAAPPKIVSRKYRKKRDMSKPRTYLKLKNRTAWATGRDRRARTKNVGAWIGSKHPGASPAIWTNYGTKTRRWKNGKNTGRLKQKNGYWIQKVWRHNKGRLEAMGHRDIEIVAWRRMKSQARQITNSSRRYAALKNRAF